jgi:hypothetical protein
MLFVDDDVYGGALAPGDGSSTYMSGLTLEDELLKEQDDYERVNLPLILFIILQKLTQKQNSWNGLGNKIVNG